MRNLITPLSELLKTADELIIGSDKKEPALSDSFVEKVAAALEESTGSIDLNSVSPAQDMEKIAEAINLIDAAGEIEDLKNLRAFEKKAKEAGHSEKDICEAIEKIAAAKFKKRLPLLVAWNFGLGTAPKAEPLTNRLQGFSRQQAASNVKTQGY